MGTGTDVAMKRAGVTLVRRPQGHRPRTKAQSRDDPHIKQGLIFAFIYNVLGVSIAAGVLYAALGILLSPMLAAATVSLSSKSVIGNALRPRRVRL